MSAPVNPAAAFRLCGACGLCCNGVLFHTVKLQPADSAQDLVALGLRIQRKKGGQLFQQPCAAFRGSCCAIYPSRPERCRLFECQQLRRLAKQEITENEALQTIQEVKNRVARITVLLDRAGKTNERRPLLKRYEKIMAEPAFENGAVSLHQELTREMEEMDAILDRDFRVSESA